MAIKKTVHKLVRRLKKNLRLRLIACMLLSATITFAQPAFHGYAEFETVNNKGMKWQTKIAFADSAIYIINDSTYVNDGFDRVLLKVENGKVNFYQINSLLKVALVQEREGTCGYYSAIVTDSAGYGVSKVAGNPLKDKSKAEYFEAVYTYDKRIPVLLPQFQFKCLPLVFLMNGSLIVSSQSKASMNNSDTSIVNIQLRKLSREEAPVSLFTISDTIQVEKYTIERMGELSFFYKKLRQYTSLQEGYGNSTLLPSQAIMPMPSSMADSSILKVGVCTPDRMPMALLRVPSLKKQPGMSLQ